MDKLTTQQKYERDLQIYKQFHEGVRTGIIAERFGVTTQTVRNIAKTKPSVDRLYIENTVIDLWYETKGEYRDRVRSVSETTGLNKCQVRYIIGKNKLK